MARLNRASLTKANKMLKSKLLPALIAGAAIFAAGPTLAAEHVVKMLNSGADGAMVYEPSVIRAKPGDTVRFVPTTKGHNAELIAGMAPAGVTFPKGAMGKEYVVKVDKAGVYGFKCAPHYGMGMVALVQVGNAPNRAAAEAVAAKAPGVAKKRFAAMFARLK